MNCSSLEQYRLSWLLFEKMKFVEKYHMNMKKYSNFIFEVKKQYNYYNNSYHNWEHGLTGNTIHI